MIHGNEKKNEKHGEKYDAEWNLQVKPRKVKTIFFFFFFGSHVSKFSSKPTVDMPFPFCGKRTLFFFLFFIGLLQPAVRMTNLQVFLLRTAKATKWRICGNSFINTRISNLLLMASFTCFPFILLQTLSRLLGAFSWLTT